MKKIFFSVGRLTEKLSEQVLFRLHLLKEFPILPRQRQIQVVGIFFAALSLVITAAGLTIKSLSGPNLKSPLAEGQNQEIAVTRMAPSDPSPFFRMSGKILGFSDLKIPKHKNLQYEVFGYLPWWSFDKIQYLHLDLLSTIAYFGLEIDPQKGGFLQNWAYWDFWNSPELKDLIDRSRKSGTNVVLTIKLFDNDPIETFLRCSACRQKTVSETVAQIREKGVQGVNVDFEYYGSPDNETTIRFAQFMRDLADAVHKEIKGSTVSMAVYATSAREERIHDIAVVGQFIDYVVIMGYDFFRPASTNAGPISPLTGVEKYGFDLETSVKDFLAKIPAEKIVLGVPYYGYDWPVESNSPNAKVLPYDDQNGTVGLAYYANVAENPKIGINNSGWDSIAQVPFYSYFNNDTKVWHEVYYENAASLSLKYDFIKSMKIRGVGIWALGFDGDRNELWDLLEKKFTRL
ncbi:MAG: glycosyl hydrolase family 18 protein [Patescibacteria group bacterium]|nr:glycosyl hydrolase family 18 protein [Patescibacteria group bacterium]